ncbi:MAG TPA: hypothetical protein VHX62_05865 [Solirubrobacteraceae bacterium]|jgi:hypothetical protein|nr:hypothetical protein [Solirubrobacteraceae bacterium]
MEPTGGDVADRTPAQWTSDGVPNAAAEDTRLHQEGFREVVSVQTGSTHGQGISWVMQLGSASAASRELTAELHEFAYGPDAPTTTTRFIVPGVPSAKGWVFPGSDANVLFTEGPCLLLVGDALPGGDQRPVVAATHTVWARTHGKPGACAT